MTLGVCWHRFEPWKRHGRSPAPLRLWWVGPGEALSPSFCGEHQGLRSGVSLQRGATAGGVASSACVPCDVGSLGQEAVCAKDRPPPERDCGIIDRSNRRRSGYMQGIFYKFLKVGNFWGWVKVLTETSALTTCRMATILIILVVVWIHFVLFWTCKRGRYIIRVEHDFISSAGLALSLAPGTNEWGIRQPSIVPFWYYSR